MRAGIMGLRHCGFLDFGREDVGKTEKKGKKEEEKIGRGKESLIE